MQSAAHLEDSGATRPDKGKRNNDRDTSFLDVYASEDEEGVDAMGAVVFVNEEESGFFGTSSALSRADNLR